MRKIVYSILAVLCLASTGIVAQAQNSDAAGAWDVALNTPGGVRNFKAVFKVDSGKLSGEIKREGAAAADPAGLPLEGKVTGNEIQFSYTVKYQDNDLTITMTGKIDGDTMAGTASFGGFAEDEWKAKRAQDSVAAGPSQSASTDVTGDWVMQVETDAGSGSPSFTLKQEGEQLSGHYKGLLGEADLTGTVKGDQIEFSFKVSGQIEGTITYKGTTDGQTMKGKVNLGGVAEGTFTGKRK